MASRLHPPPTLGSSTGVLKTPATILTVALGQSPPPRCHPYGKVSSEKPSYRTPSAQSPVTPLLTLVRCQADEAQVTSAAVSQAGTSSRPVCIQRAPPPPTYRLQNGRIMAVWAPPWGRKEGMDQMHHRRSSQGHTSPREKAVTTPHPPPGSLYQSAHKSCSSETM